MQASTDIVTHVEPAKDVSVLLEALATSRLSYPDPW